ncbi:hypothetical protein [Cellulomonas telluris]|uniref:hypothetical protein n=1 Tax=Cellulomonas telluris TaxID=2306636 RepID=UPI0010A90194|nr:hypothetical protein [Cellulomonas telluris]
MTWDLPAGWRWTPLRELLLPVRTQLPPERIDADTLYLGLEHVQAGTGEYTGTRAGDAHLRSPKLAFEAGDVLYGKLRPNLRKCVVARSAGVCSIDLVPLRPVEPDAAHLLALQMRSDPFTADVLRLVGGVNLPRVTVRDLLTLALPVPPAADRDRVHAVAQAATTLRRRYREVEQTVLDLEGYAAEVVLGLR